MPNALVTATTTELLDGLKDSSNDAAWHLLDARFRPILVGTSRRLGLSPDEAEELAQQTLVEVFENYREGRYDRDKGRLRFWILGIARNMVRRVFQRRRYESPSMAVPDDLLDERQLSEIWDDELNHAILREAIGLLRSGSQFDQRTLMAFDLFACMDVPAVEVAAQCGMSEAQVYVAKTRVAKSLREIVSSLRAAYEAD